MKRRRILIVDDDKHIRSLLREHLGATYDVDVAESGAQAFAAVVKNRPDVILLDVTMPGISGLDVMKAIREMGVTTPILVITGNEAVAIAEKALQNGAYGYIPKPFTLAYIDHLIATALMAGTTPPASA
jgi:DNA-binding NtrC family response regulator